jgi:hypothetical protein
MGGGLRRALRRAGPAVLAYGAILVLLVALSTPRRTGDANDYLALAHHLSKLRAPTFAQDLGDIRPYFDRWGTGYEDVPMFFLVPENRGDDGRYDLQHFWFYSALVAPALAVTNAVEVHPNYAFAAVNLLLLLVAAAVVARRLGVTLTALLFLGPVVWWVDKAQTEAFTFSMLAIAMASLRDRPGVALACIGAAATQNPPLAILLAVALLAVALTQPRWWRNRGVVVGGAVGVALALLPAVYYEWRLGRLSSLHGVVQHVPTVPELRFPLFDLNFGLVPDAPVFALAVVIAFVLLVRRPRQLAAWDLAVAVAAVPIFLYAFSQSPQLAAGGTPSMTRYALWLMPLAIPLLARLRETGTVRERYLVVAAAATVVWTVASFLPSRSDQDIFQPTRLASWVWRHHPGADNPLAEVFYLKVARAYGSPQPAAVANCAKVLVVYGEWARCPVGHLPARCRTDPCYANRDGDHYEFVSAPGRGGKTLPPPSTPPDTVPVHAVTAGLDADSVRLGAGDLPLVAGRTRGSVDHSKVFGRSATFTGWAGDPDSGHPAREVLVFADGRALGAAPPTLERPDVAAGVGAGLARSGFSLTVPLRGLQSTTRRFRVQLVGVGDGKAWILPYLCADPGGQDFGCG